MVPQSFVAPVVPIGSSKLHPSKFDITRGGRQSRLARRLSVFPEIPPAPRRTRPAARGANGPFASLIPPSASYAQYAALACCAAGGQMLGKQTRVGRALSAPVVTMLLAALLLNLGVLPVASPAIPPLQAAATRVATPLLLLGADLRIVLGSTRRLTVAFVFASLATVVGALVAWTLVGQWMPANGWQLAAAIAAKNVGGGMNYLAVLDTYGASASLLALGLSADNLLGLLYFPLNSWLADRFGSDREDIAEANGRPGQRSAPERRTASKSEPSDLLTLPSLTRAVAVSLAVVAASQLAFPAAPVPAAAALSVFLATAMPRTMQPLAPAGTALGSLALYSLFAAAGASGGTLRSVARSPAGATAVVAFCAILYAIHTGLVGIAAAMSNAKMKDDGKGRRLVLASNAAIGGPATAAALAESKGWETAVVPATVVGQLGNAVGSWIGLGVGLAIVRIFASATSGT